MTIQDKLWMKSIIFYSEFAWISFRKRQGNISDIKNKIIKYLMVDKVDHHMAQWGSGRRFPSKLDNTFLFRMECSLTNKSNCPVSRSRH